MGGREGAGAEEMERGIILSYPQCSIVILLQPHSYPLTNPNLHLHLSQKPNFSSHLRFSHRRWDSNAETFRTQRSRFNFRDTADDDDDDDESQEMDPGSALLEEVIDSFWIFKVKEFHCSLCICELELGFTLKYAHFRYMENERSSISCEELMWSVVVLFFLSVFSGIVWVRVWECVCCFWK